MSCSQHKAMRLSASFSVLKRLVVEVNSIYFCINNNSLSIIYIKSKRDNYMYKSKSRCNFIKLNVAISISTILIAVAMITPLLFI